MYSYAQKYALVKDKMPLALAELEAESQRIAEAFAEQWDCMLQWRAKVQRDV